jgi:spoIIIJ-associated protein
MQSAEDILKELLGALGVSYSGIQREELAGQEILAIQTDDPRTLIGSHGDTVHALDLLVKKIYEKRNPTPEGGDPSTKLGTSGPLFLVDVNDYRSKQIKDLQAKALMMAERARSFQYDVELSPMTAYERLIVHSTLSGQPHVKTESQGEGRNRRVVIKYSAE